MSAPMSGPIAIGALDLAALLCSRVCHDLISPVGAIVNGLEVLDEDKDEETKVFALDLIKKSAHQASAKLQFCRIAFGAAGSAGAQIDLGDAEKVARGLLADDRTTIAWNLHRELLPKNRVKLLLNMLLIAVGTIPRGGTITVDPAEGGLCLLEQTAHVRRLGDVGLRRDGLAAFGCDRGHNALCALLVGRIIDHHGGACRRQGFGGRGADAFGGAGDHRDFSFEIAHRSLSLRIAVWRRFHNSIIIELLMSVELWCGAVNRKGESNYLVRLRFWRAGRDRRAALDGAGSD